MHLSVLYTCVFHMFLRKVTDNSCLSLKFSYTLFLVQMYNLIYVQVPLPSYIFKILQFAQLMAHGHHLMGIHQDTYNTYYRDRGILKLCKTLCIFSYLKDP